jgi:hypothetical protein
MCEEIAKPKPETFRVCPLSEYGTFTAIAELLQETPVIPGRRSGRATGKILCGSLKGEDPCTP